MAELPPLEPLVTLASAPEDRRSILGVTLVRGREIVASRDVDVAGRDPAALGRELRTLADWLDMEALRASGVTVIDGR